MKQSTGDLLTTTNKALNVQVQLVSIVTMVLGSLLTLSLVRALQFAFITSYDTMLRRWLLASFDQRYLDLRLAAFDAQALDKKTRISALCLFLDFQISPAFQTFSNNFYNFCNLHNFINFIIFGEKSKQPNSGQRGTKDFYHF